MTASQATTLTKTAAQPKVWLITGTSTGLGRALAETVLAHGDRVVVTARNPAKVAELVERYPSQALAARLDVTQPEQIQAVVEKTIQRFGRIDVVVNNAGYGVTGGIEEVSLQMVREQYETNLFGAWSVIQATLPQLRKQRSGHILNVSSLVGRVAFAGMGVYSSSKFALEGMSEALAQEVAPLGIKVTILEPGAFRTAFNGGSLTAGATGISDYEAVTGQFHQWLKEVHGEQPGDPVKAANAMIQVVESEAPPLRLALGEDAITTIEESLKVTQAEADAWREVTLSTAFEGAVVSAVGG